jgi:hypothetical protein
VFLASRFWFVEGQAVSSFRLRRKEKDLNCVAQPALGAVAGVVGELEVEVGSQSIRFFEVDEFHRSTAGSQEFSSEFYPCGAGRDVFDLTS